MSSPGAPASEARPTPSQSLMDDIYRHQRHFYDFTRKYYLLGRDRLIAELDIPDGGSVLELGCGTGRNLIMAARRYPGARLYGIDLSGEMLDTAARSIERAGLSDRIRLARGDAGDFDAEFLFGQSRFDRVFLSYSLSMIPPWEKTIEAGIDALSTGGSLHIVDFGDQSRLPFWFRSVLRRWLGAFHVEPRDDLPEILENLAESHGFGLKHEWLYRGYAQYARLDANRNS